MFDFIQFGPAFNNLYIRNQYLIFKYSKSAHSFKIRGRKMGLYCIAKVLENRKNLARTGNLIRIIYTPGL
jgi:hypothetical protein